MHFILWCVFDPKLFRIRSVELVAVDTRSSSCWSKMVAAPVLTGISTSDHICGSRSRSSYKDASRSRPEAWRREPVPGDAWGETWAGLPPAGGALIRLALPSPPRLSAVALRAGRRTQRTRESPRSSASAALLAGNSCSGPGPGRAPVCLSRGLISGTSSDPACVLACRRPVSSRDVRLSQAGFRSLMNRSSGSLSSDG